MEKRNRKNPMRNAIQVRMNDIMYAWIETEAGKINSSPADVIRKLIAKAKVCDSNTEPAEEGEKVIAILHEEPFVVWRIANYWHDETGQLHMCKDTTWKAL